MKKIKMVRFMFIINKDESDDEKDHKEGEHKDKQKEETKNQKNFREAKEFFTMNFLYIGAASLISTYLILVQGSGIQEISIMELDQYLETNMVKSFEIGKEKLSTFYTVLVTLTDDRINKLTIVNNDQFIQGIEQKLKEMVIYEIFTCF
jgi:hypothetical protein